jgi:glycosyltransferase involved in cell wall biosynthesis
MITVLLTEAFRSKGGISRFNGFLIKALCRAHEESSEKIRVLSLNDTANVTSLLAVDALALNGTFKFYGANRNKISFAIDSILQALPSDLLIIGHVSLAPIGHMLKLLKPSLRYAVITHGIEAWNVKRSLERKALDKADFILSVSRFTRDKLVEQGFRRAKILLLPNAVDEHLFSPQGRPERLLRKYRLDAGQPIVLTVGRLDPSEKYKGYDVALKALGRVVRVHPRAQLMLVGTGGDRPRLETLARDLGLLEHVIFAGQVPDEELPDYYNLCHVFAMPSKKEGFGIVFLEALACGKPVIAGNRDGSRDALLDGRLGILVDPDDDAAVAAAILDVLNGHLKGGLSDSDFLRKTVLEHYSFECFRERLTSFLRSTNGYHPEI